MSSQKKHFNKNRFNRQKNKKKTSEPQSQPNNDLLKWQSFFKNDENGNVTIPLAFAKDLLKQKTFDPSKSNNKNVTYSNYTKENIVKWLQNPTSNEENLRNASNYLYLSSMHYQRLINYYANLMLWAYVISPLNYDSKKMKEDNFRKQFLKIASSLELMNIPETMRSIMKTILREGVFYGVRWEDNNTSFVQKIDAKYCKVSSIADGCFLYCVDMSQIGENKLDFYPQEFTEMFKRYKETNEKWQEVPSNVSVCLKADSSIIYYSVPPFAAVMPQLYTIANTEALQETADELNNYKMLSCTIPLNKDGQPTIGYDLARMYYQNLCNAVGDRVGVSMTPFTIKDFNFQDSGQIAEIDNINRAVGNFWTSAGTSGLLHGVANSTSGVTKLAIKNDESFVTDIMKQAERMFNRHLKIAYSGTIKFKITFLPITIYNQEDYVKMYKEAVPFGIGISYYMAALGVPQYDVEGLTALETKILKYPEILTPLINSHNASASQIASGNTQAGRPEQDSVDDEGEKTRDNDENSNR